MSVLIISGELAMVQTLKDVRSAALTSALTQSQPRHASLGTPASLGMRHPHIHSSSVLKGQWSLLLRLHPSGR